MTLTLQTDWQTSAPLDLAKATARFRGGAYSDAQVSEFLARLTLHANLTGMAAAALAGQVGKETGWFRFGGQAQPEQFNFAGIGTVNDGGPGHTFGSIEGGVRGLIAHHGNYRWGDYAHWPDPWVPYQPDAIRHQAVMVAGYGGVVKTIGDFTNGRWAWTPGVPIGSLQNGYAAGIVANGNSILGQGAPVANFAIHDIRRELPTKAGQGSGRTMSAVLGQVLHYSAVDYPRDRPTLDILKSEAGFHIGPYLKEFGLAYHFCVDPWDGTIYQTRDEDACLWHCGSWETPGNGNGLSIHVPGGNSLRMSDVAVQALCWLFRRNQLKYGFGRSRLVGHQEVGSSSCPGPLMQQVVYPFRAGTIGYTEGGGIVGKPVTQDPVTGIYIHPDLQDTYDFAKHGHALLPACGYTDGKVRQLFERACLESGGARGEDVTASLGQALLYMTGGGGDQGARYPEWATVKPLL